jgi:hypothetical protein
MRKVEKIKTFVNLEPDELDKAVNAWIIQMSEAREKNVAVNSVAFYQDIIHRAIVSGSAGKASVMIAYHDYVLQKHEAGGAKHHKDEAEGISAVGPDFNKKARK